MLLAMQIGLIGWADRSDRCSTKLSDRCATGLLGGWKRDG
jgi:hypothetical protein